MRMSISLRLAVPALIAAAATSAEDWPQWRGPAGSGVSNESSGWPEGWPPTRLWSRNVGKGCTSPIIAGGQVFVMGWAGPKAAGNPQGTDTVFCIDARTGKELWKQQYTCRYQGRLRIGDKDAYGGPSATPSFDKDTGYLYTLSIDGDLCCWNAREQGRPVWKRNLHKHYEVARRPDSGGGQRDFGFTAAPLILGNLVIVEVGAQEGTLIAFHKETGAQQWASEYTLPAGHTGGLVPLTLDGKQCLAFLSLFELVIVSLEKGYEGKVLQTHKWQTDFACNIPTPAVCNGAIVLTSGYNRHSTARLSIEADGPGEKAAAAVWSARQYATVSSPVIHDGRVYVIGGALNCLDVETGARLWSGGSFGHGSCILTAGDGKIIAFGERRLALIDAKPQDGQYHELARIDGVVGGICYPHIALSAGIICCKDRDGNIVTYSIHH